MIHCQCNFPVRTFVCTKRGSAYLNHTIDVCHHGTCNYWRSRGVLGAAPLQHQQHQQHQQQFEEVASVQRNALMACAISHGYTRISGANCVDLVAMLVRSSGRSVGEVRHALRVRYD